MTSEERETLEAVNYLKENNRLKEAVLPLSLDPLVVRYFAYNPVVYAWKDAGMFAYANHADLLKWHKKNSDISKALRDYEENKEAGINNLISIAKGFNAGYLVLKTSDLPQTGFMWPKVVFRNKSHTIIYLSQKLHYSDAEKN